MKRFLNVKGGGVTLVHQKVALSTLTLHPCTMHGHLVQHKNGYLLVKRRYLPYQAQVTLCQSHIMGPNNERFKLGTPNNSQNLSQGSQGKEDRAG